MNLASGPPDPNFLRDYPPPKVRRRDAFRMENISPQSAGRKATDLAEVDLLRGPMHSVKASVFRRAGSPVGRQAIVNGS